LALLGDGPPQAAVGDTIFADPLHFLQQNRNSLSHEARKTGMGADAPAELKRQIIRLLIDRIVINASERWLKIDGAIPLSLTLGGGRGASIVFDPASSIG
jgi:hypothetical protein